MKHKNFLARYSRSRLSILKLHCKPSFDPRTITKKEADGVIRAFFLKYPIVAAWIRKVEKLEMG